MVTTYKATIEVNCWKEHTCSGCGGVFSYLFKRKKVGQGRTKEAASVAVRQAVVQALANEVDLQPCPSCGLYQPDMVGARRARRHGYLFWGALILLAGLLLCGAADFLSFDLVTWLSAGVAALVLFGHLWIDWQNPNRDLGANQERALQLLEQGTLRQRTAGDQNQVEPETGAYRWSFTHQLVFLLLGLQVLVLATPELVRRALGWPLNPEWYVPVAGPGDDPYTYFPGRPITSVKGYWRGQDMGVEVLNAAELNIPNLRLTASTANDSWGQNISAKSSEKSSSPRLWARLHVPNTPGLEGKTLQLKMNLLVSYPALRGTNSFQEVHKPVSHTASIQLASAGAGATYRSLWWLGELAGSLLMVILSYCLVRLAYTLKKAAQPTNIYFPENAGDASP